MSDARIRAVITGLTGRMGSTLARMCQQDSTLLLVGGTERKGHPAIGTDAGLAAKLPPLGALLVDDLARAIEMGKAQVVIDFTNAEASVEHAKICSQKNAALVIGSTGFTPETRASVARAAEKVPVVMSPNMSVGVNLVIRMAAELAKVLGDSYDIEILETHHRMKKDAPSGTALKLAEVVAQALNRSSDNFRMERRGQIGERPSKEIGIQTLRGGDVVGEHTVFFYGEGERVELSHRATSRDQFGQGALRAAKWVTQRRAGLYDMQDVLGLR